jgi:uncharacterized Zn finger protein
MSKKSYPIRIPRYAAGIRAQEARSGSGRTWWAKRWIHKMESMGLGPRLGRGKNYAVSGQVISLAVSGNRVEAKVQGARPDPYLVTLDFRELPAEAKDRIVAALKAEPMLVARLLADDLPLQVEELFRSEGCDFFPGGRLDGVSGRRYDMVSDCACPDYANPCKHVTAVLVLLGEEIARRPSLLLELRGISMEDLCDED